MPVIDFGVEVATGGVAVGTGELVGVCGSVGVGSFSGAEMVPSADVVGLGGDCTAGLLTGASPDRQEASNMGIMVRIILNFCIQRVPF